MVEGENGFLAPSAYAEDLAALIVRAHALGEQLRESSLAWFDRHRTRLSLESSFEIVSDVYGGE